MQNNQKHMMIDIETLGRNPGCVILSIGAVIFDIEKGYDDTSPCFHRIIDMESCIAAGLTIEADTLKWWLKQDEKTREYNFNGGHDIREALYSFSNWVKFHAPDIIWANSPKFDCSILEYAFAKINRSEPPWKYNQLMDYRTIMHLAPKDIKDLKIPELSSHDALDDCRYQIIKLVKTMRYLKSIKEGECGQRIVFMVHHGEFPHKNIAHEGLLLANGVIHTKVGDNNYIIDPFKSLITIL